ncbi:2-amino-4-hydroxy-6-hydroxymethyldihydropteridine diphosphokinase [Sphingobium sp. DC-2]|uniref:2-amino-4-hydroxy-6- hydroxymethyldihydropteridine diphosphokinase n=1 Tax=Sphingobium sp. DC-2 TaxID=1303256 RepID=UPI0004C37845|nr:2-amino-4-hydroxy-6-hydroxymethyldihydropteridine diphosphokinase [Sphingobium sp. DC-2]
MSAAPAFHLYALALGSNRALSARRTPARLLYEAAARIGELGQVRAMAPVMPTRPLGPSARQFANSALIVESRLTPGEMLLALQRIETQLGRRRHRRWGARSMDIDIILWSGGQWKSRSLLIPHPAFRQRAFVLGPLSQIAPAWRDPLSGRSVRHIEARLGKASPIERPRG